MRLVHYYPRALVGDGGPTYAMWQWASAAHRIGCNVAVLYDVDLETQSPLRDAAVPIVPVKHAVLNGIYIPRTLSSALRPGDVLVLHSAYMPGNLAAAAIARGLGLPYIVMPHGGYDRKSRARRRLKKTVWQPFERAYLEHALGVHVFFETEAADTLDIAPRARWIVAPTGCDLQEESWDGGTGGYLAWLGRYDIRHKGLDLLIEAMSRLSIRVPLRLHGRPSENSLEEVQRLALAAGVEDRVSVNGSVGGSDKRLFLRQAAAYIHASRWESHSIVLVDAMAHGIPSVVSASCAIAPRLRSANAAIVVPPTPESIAQGILGIIRNPRPYSQRAIHFVRTNLAWNPIITDYLIQIDRLRSRNHAGIGEPSSLSEHGERQQIR